MNFFRHFKSSKLFKRFSTLSKTNRADLQIAEEYKN